MLVAGWADGYRNATFRVLERLAALGVHRLASAHPGRAAYDPPEIMTADLAPLALGREPARDERDAAAFRALLTDATVVPSLYEPFGMVALEAAAAGAPLAVAATGGLAEIVEPGITGVTFPHSDPEALAGAVDRLLADEVFARRVARRARSMVGERYSWPAIAQRTVQTYRAATREDGRHQPAAAHAKIVVPEGNLLFRDDQAS